MTNQHVTDEQFTGILAGDCTLEVNQHLQACPQCQAEAERVLAAINDFSAAGMEWAEQQAPSFILVRSPFVPRWQLTTSWAAVAVLATAVLFGIHQEKKTVTSTVMTASSEQAEAPADVADDNRLLAAIDTEIRWQAQSPLLSQTADRRSRVQPQRKLAN